MSPPLSARRVVGGLAHAQRGQAAVQRGVNLGAVAAEELPGAVAAALRLTPDPIEVVLDNPGSTYRAASACGPKTSSP